VRPHDVSIKVYTEGMTLPKKPIGLLTNSDKARFWAKVDTSGDCWEWTAYRDAAGYGIFQLGKTGPRKAHRVSWALTNGEPDPALVIDHLCRNRACVNPDHMEQVTQRSNVLRGTAPAAQQARRTECRHGHPLSGSNLMVSRGRRICRTCHRASNLRSIARRKAAQNG
jgi:hypothetical protein